ncbi:uracil-DNA glycosylase family protein [Hydrogenophaga sp. Root209]|uniref:uracil-DNA glycosylase family protein n=1 Tax=Hydrogenophaga sp. Root209 TaxID=1736490 RepID=UPI0012E3E41B|nr:uracil-DNA glycosylase family protein [Hydrogenophaga sp. Root209]
MTPKIMAMRLLDGKVPASNLIFVRSRREEFIKEVKSGLAALCWPFHAQVIAELRPRVVLCLGATAGNFVRERLLATRLVGQFIEVNNRRWKSQVFDGTSGLKVVVAMHPSIADWCAAATDPSALVEAALR